IGTGHLLLGMLRIENSLAARLLRERGVKPQVVREELAKSPPSSVAMTGSRAVSYEFEIRPYPSLPATATLDSFLAGLKKDRSWETLAHFFAKDSQIVDCTGKRWQGLEEIEKRFEALFAPYAKKNVTFILEGTSAGPGDCLFASILWE